MSTKTKEKIITKEIKAKRVKATKPAGLSIPVYSLKGEETGQMSLPEDIFGVKVNPVLIAQAVRVYFNNLRMHSGNTKTRSEVQGSTRKIYKQKGTGGARHGGIRAPIFVGGGIALGPKSHKVTLNLPEKMKSAALKSALSDKFQSKEVLGIDFKGISGKTSQLARFLAKLNKKSALLLLGEKDEKVMQAAGNIKGLKALLADQLNTLELIKYKTMLLTEESVEKLTSRMVKGNK